MSIERVFKLTSTDEARTVYDEWAERYNHDMLGDTQNYVAPTIASEYVKKYAGTPGIDALNILDAGCGTGLVGIELAKQGAGKIDGIDLSPGMLKVARETGVYRSLSIADLSKPLEQASQAYDVIVCVGTMTQGHVGPEAFDEFVRIGKPGGFIVSTVRETVWEKNGYKDKVRSLEGAGKARLLSSGFEDYRRGQGARAVMVVLQIQ